MADRFFLSGILARLQRLGLPWLGIVAAVISLLIGSTRLWQNIELKLFDQLIVATAPNAVNLPITIIGIDEPSFAKIKQQWPWPRSLHGQLLDNLREAGVAVVGFDVVFSEPTSPAEDATFAEALRRHGNVVLAADMVYDETGSVRQWLRVEPLGLFGEAGAVTGFASVQIDPDGVQRQVPDSQDAFGVKVLSLLDKRSPGVVAQLGTLPNARIRYLGDAHTFTYIPYYQLLEPDKYLSPNWKEYLQDNIVIVGRDLKATTEVRSAQSDMFQTPFFWQNHQLMPGAEIQANLIANMVNGDTLQEAPRSWSLLLWFVAAAISITLMRRWRPLPSGIVALLLVGCIVAVDYTLFVEPQVWLPAAGAILTVCLVYLAQGSVAYFFEQQQRRQIKHAFSKYVAPAIVEEVLAQPEKLKLGGERRELTLIITDLAGFTSISEVMEAEQVAAILNRHLSEMTEIVLRHHGTVDKFIGDAVMAFWGAPVPDQDQSLHAVEAAIEMQEKIAIMRREILADGGPELCMRIGVHRGECIVGNLGGDNRFDYTAIGDAVNLTSRLEGVNKFYGTGILVSEAVVKAVTGKTGFRQIDTVRVKGKQLGIGIYTPCEDALLTQLTESALAAYRNGEWELAMERWNAVLENYTNDPVAQVFANRLLDFKNTGLPENWDGISTLDAK